MRSLLNCLRRAANRRISSGFTMACAMSCLFRGVGGTGVDHRGPAGCGQRTRVGGPIARVAIIDAIRRKSECKATQHPDGVQHGRATSERARGAGMTELYILRHGIAYPHGTPGMADDDRPLTPKGEERCKQISKGL